MKSVYFCVFLLAGAMAAYSQNSMQLPSTINTTTTDNRWNLNKYVWSHTHPRPSASDKPVLDYSAIDNWVSLSDQGVAISPNGTYFVYGVQNSLKRRIDTVIVQSTINSWRAVLPSDARPGFFSPDSRQYIFQDKSGLCFLQTGTKERRYEKVVETYKTDNKKEWLIYRLADIDKTLVLLHLINDEEQRVNGVESYNFNEIDTLLAYQLQNKHVVLRNLTSKKELEFDNVDNYNFDRSGTWFVCKSNDSSQDLVLYNLKGAKEQRFSGVQSYQFFASGDYLLLNSGKGLAYVSLGDAKRTMIWFGNDTSTTIKSTRFDGTGKQVVFVTEREGKRAIWYWKSGMVKAEMKVNDQTMDLGKNVLTQDRVDFTDNGRYIRFAVKPVVFDSGIATSKAIQVDVWSYQDRILQSTQPYLKEIKTYSGILNLETGKVILKENQFEKLGMIRGDFALISKSGTDIYGDRFWEKGYYEDSIWLISLQTGIRRLMPIKRLYNSIWFSPDGRYLVYFDASKECNYFSYELATGKLINISVGVPAWQLGLAQPNLRTSEKPIWGSGIILWLMNNKGFWVYDNYGDIWQLNLNDKKMPVCITNEYGHSQYISFNLLNLQGDNDKSFIGKDTLLLSAFNRKTKWHGFYQKVLGSKGDPELLSINPCFMQGLWDGFDGFFPLKAGKSNIWIVNRQTATEAPNYFVTHDFKAFKQLTHLQPHKNYNWLTAELHSFKQLDGTISQGILYKPENFNPDKKYPLIISFYGTLSDQLYKYPTANYITAPDIFDDPAWMVSHGYLVFIPDIYFIKNLWGPSTVNTVDGAAQYLRRLPYVDGHHMGAAGHSNSGNFGYYLLTHSHAFTAMSVGAGATNVINGYLSIGGSSQNSKLELGEVSSFGTGLGSLWKNKSSWLDQTSVLSADKAVAPLLQFHCKKDRVPIEQAIQMFTALRRLGKKVWWLQYDNGGHRVNDDDARDWTIRYTQFFDHYLKGAPAPLWMTQGIPYTRKGIESRYDLDMEGTCGNNCPICREKKWSYQINKSKL